MIQAVLRVVHLTSPPQLGFEIASSLRFGNPLVTSLYLSLLIKKEIYFYLCADMYGSVHVLAVFTEARKELES